MIINHVVAGMVPQVCRHRFTLQHLTQSPSLKPSPPSTHVAMEKVLTHVTTKTQLPRILSCIEFWFLDVTKKLKCLTNLHGPQVSKYLKLLDMFETTVSLGQFGV